MQLCRLFKQADVTTNTQGLVWLDTNQKHSLYVGFVGNCLRKKNVITASTYKPRASDAEGAFTPPRLRCLCSPLSDSKYHTLIMQRVLVLKFRLGWAANNGEAAGSGGRRLHLQLI